MSKYTYSTAGVLPEDRGSGEDNVLMLNPAGKQLNPAPSGIFSLRRASYFNKAKFDETGHSVRRSDLAEAAIAEATGELQQGAAIRNHQANIPRR